MTAYDAFYDPARLKRVRRVYLAELEEFDAMVGKVVDAVRAAGRSDDTYIVLAAGEAWFAGIKYSGHVGNTNVISCRPR